METGFPSGELLSFSRSSEPTDQRQCRACATRDMSSPESVISETTSGLCPVCRSASDGKTIECPDCHAVHHRECWDYNGGCGKYGCPSAPPTDKLTDVEVPP